MWQFAQYSTTSSGSASVGPVVIILYLLLIAVFVIAFWKIFTKAGQEGWKAIIPFYNIYTLLKIVGLPAWYLVLYLIPVVNIVIAIMVYRKLARAFGYGVGMTILLIFGIGDLILGFGKSKYLGPDGNGSASPPTAGSQPPVNPPTNPVAPQQPPAPTTPPAQPLVQ